MSDKMEFANGYLKRVHVIPLKNSVGFISNVLNILRLFLIEFNMRVYKVIKY